MANANTTSMSDAIKTMYEKRLLIRAVPRNVYGRWGRVAQVNQFGAYELRRFESMPLVSTTLVEANTPTELAQPSITKVTMTPSWYGAWISYSDQLITTSFDPIISEISGLLGEQVGISFDTLIRNSITSGATKTYAGTAAARTDIDTTNDLISYDSFVKTLATLQVNNARPGDNGMYPVLLHPYSWATLMMNDDFIALFTREGGQAMRNGLIGTILNCEIYVSSNGRVYADGGTSSADVYDAMFIGEEGYGLAGFSGLMVDYQAGFGAGEYDNLTGDSGIKPVQLITKELGETGLDPLNQRGTIGWKATHTTSILNSAFIVSHEHATTQS